MIHETEPSHARLALWADLVSSLLSLHICSHCNYMAKCRRAAAGLNSPLDKRPNNRDYDAMHMHLVYFILFICLLNIARSFHLCLHVTARFKCKSRCREKEKIHPGGRLGLEMKVARADSKQACTGPTSPHTVNGADSMCGNLFKINLFVEKKIRRTADDIRLTILNIFLLKLHQH